MLASAGRLLSLAVILIPLQSVFWSPGVPVVLKLVAIAVAALACARPAEALLAAIGLAPFSYGLTTRVWPVHPLAFGEALVLAVLGGYLLRTWREAPASRRAPDALTVSAWVFALVVLASCAVQFASVRAWHDYPLAYAGTFLTYLARDYLTTVPDPRPWVEGHGFVRPAALLLEGLALMLVARALCRRHPELERRILTVVVVAGAGAAALGVVTFAQAALGGDLSMTGPDVRRRWSSFVPSLNSTAAYFALVALAAFGLAARVRPRIVPLAAGALALVAMWLTRTHSALLATLAVGAGCLVWFGSHRWRTMPPWKVAAVAAATAMTVGVVAIALNPGGLLAERAYKSLHLRALFTETSLGMIEDQPIFGVGPGQYGWRSPDYSSDELLGYYARSAAHNNFLWVAAEFGLVGLAAFLWLIGTAANRAWRRLRSAPDDLYELGLSAALLAFVSTWLSWQPLEVPAVAYTFWILLGVAVSGVTDPADAPRSAPGTPRPWVRAALAVFVVFVVASVPFRAREAIDAIDFSRVSYGFHLWETEPSGLRYRWTGARATFFVPAAVRVIDLPLRAYGHASAGVEAVVVRVRVDHVAAGLARLADDRWQRLRVPLPAAGGAGRFRRVDLEVSPTWRPAALLPGSTDPRVLGVKVGEIEADGRVHSAGR